ncbi:MAG: N-acetylneuraminate synthase [Promethearchaeota archaeon]
MKNKVTFGSRTIGDGEPIFIIAEAGVNHNGKMELAKQLADIAFEAGVDAVKFQTFKTEEVATREAKMAEYQKEQLQDMDSQFEMIKKLELDYEKFAELKEYCDGKGILFLSTPHNPGAAVFLENLMPIYKIGSGDLTNLPFLEQVARYGKPIILSTGMSTIDEIAEAVNSIKQAQNTDIILLHCVTSYPANIEDANLRAINTLKETFSLPVGYSDHTLGLEASIAAVALGACVIEKHFTISKDLIGPDHKASLEPTELQELVKNVRNLEKALGDGDKKPTSAERAIMGVVRKSLVAKVPIPKGTVIRDDMISIKRPGHGIAPKFLNHVIGKKASVDIKEDTVLSMSMIE